MNKKDFEKKLNGYLKKIDIWLNEEQVDKFYKYMELLIEWNEKMNLTAIIEPDDIILKHFVDSLTIEKYIKKEAELIDVGTGAGFPGIPLKIYRKDIEIVLLDSLNKRIIFLDEVIKYLELDKIKTIHSRAEDIGMDEGYREKFDIATSRAVANLSTLSEYLIPLVDVGGKIVSMKGPIVEEEVECAKKAISVLGGEIEKTDVFDLPNTDMKRTNIVIKKVKNTPVKYPRKSGIPTKEPIQ